MTTPRTASLLIFGTPEVPAPPEYPEVEHCKGKFYRYHENVYIGGKGEFIRKETISPLKRMSCVGCKDCQPGEDGAYDWVNEAGYIPDYAGLNHGHIVKLTWVGQGRGPEDIHEEFEPAFIKYKGE